MVDTAKTQHPAPEPAGGGRSRGALDRGTARVDDVAARLGPVAVRWLAGLLWLSNVNWKTPPDFGGDGGCAGLCGFVAAGVDHPVLPGSAALFEHLLLPRLALFGWVTLVVEVALAAMLLSGRFLRTAAVLGMIQSVAIGLAVANAPGEWFWAYLLMFGLHLAVLVQARGARPTSGSAMAVVTVGYGVLVALSHAGAGPTGDGTPAWTLFAGADGTINDLPDELGRNLFTGSLALGAALVVLGGAAWILSRREARVRVAAGWVVVGVAAVGLLTYRSSGLAIGWGSSAATTGVLAALGLSLTAPVEDPEDTTTA
jgi:hypothetical protein